ncbi:MAG TPA: YoaK family protein [Chitinophagaceae bacterium]|nr:YoaK family protein [Chitinophagaceae bacterium]
MIKERNKLNDKIRFGMMYAGTAGMVNVSSLVLFFSFTSNVTGHYAILANEIANGNLFKILIAFLWILLYFAGSFFSHFLIRSGASSNTYLTHAVPMIVEIICLVSVGLYGHYLYAETLIETELLVAVLLFAMGLQNGLTASIASFSLKTTHLTGLTTDLAIHLSMLYKKNIKNKEAIRSKLKLMLSIAVGYLIGGAIAGKMVHYAHFMVFIYIAIAMVGLMIYDWSRTFSIKEMVRRERAAQKELFEKAANAEVLGKKYAR